MKFKISHALIDTLEDRDNLHASITRIRAFLLNTLGQETFTVADINLIRANLLVHECFSMIGIPNRAKLNSPLHLKDEVKKLFNGEESLDPFTHTKFEITQNSIEFQDKILAAEVLESQEEVKVSAEEEMLIDYPCEIHDFIIEKVLAANGNLTINFFCLLLKKYVDCEFKDEIDSIKCYEFLSFHGSYLDLEAKPNSEFCKSDYKEYVEYFAYVDEHEDTSSDLLLQNLAHLQNFVSEYILGTITEGGELIEKLLISLLGHENSTIRDAAIKYLNCFYDGTIWKIESPVSTEVKYTGDLFEIKFTPTISSTSYYLALNIPSKNSTCISWHRIPKSTKVNKEVQISLGHFEFCGFYDYKIVRLKKDSVEYIEHRRVIVHNSFIKKANIHEIVVDLFGAKKDSYTGVITERGNIKTVANSIDSFEKRGIDTLYISGVHKRAHDDPYSISSRVKIDDSIGGEQEFKELLVDGLHEREMKIIVDVFDRIGSIHMSGKYRKLLLNHIDSKKIFTKFHGADGKSNFSYSTTSILNYRKKEAWDLLIQDAIKFVNEFRVDGLNLDNCDLWPTMKRIDKAEMFRRDDDEEPCYSPFDILNGEVIKGEFNHTIWTDCTECPNPFLVKLMKELWRNFPELIVVGECWQENSEAVVELSGVIPKSNALVKNIYQDILSPKDSSHSDFNKFKFNEEFLKDYCNGAILLQSTNLYSKINPLKELDNSYLTIIDTLFFHEVVPVTMHEELSGIDSEVELYLQYFNYNYREMHAAIPRKVSSKKFEDLMLGSEDEDEEEKIVELTRKSFEQKVSKRFERDRQLRKTKYSLRYGTNVPLTCLNSSGKVKTILAYSRYTDHEISIIVSNFEEYEQVVWVDFLNLREHLKHQIKSETTIVMIKFWESDRQEYHLINEFLNCPSKFTVDGYDSLLFQISIIGNIESHPEFYGDARNNFLETLNFIQNATHMEASHIYSNYIKHLVECYNSHRDPEYSLKISSKEDSLVDFHKFVSKDPKVLHIIETIVEKNLLGPIAFVTCELAPWFKIGGLAVMVDELSRGCANLGQDTYVIVPYYQYKKGSKDSIELDPQGKYGIKYLYNIEVNIGDCHEVFGIHYGLVNGVKIYFIHHSVQFYEPYPGFNNETRLRACTLFCKASLQLLCDIKVIPEVVITNDWFCAFTAGYARDENHFGTIFENTSFMHIFHNLDVNYEGRFYTKRGETLEHIHCLPNDWLIDPYWSDHIINPSRLALIASDQWTTVSKSYLEEIRYGSPLSPLLNKFPEPFACSNGVSVKDRLKELASELKKRNLKHMDHLDAKKFLMNKYLKTPELDKDLCIFSFVGRITEQKGVDMICSVVEEVITKHDYKVAFIVGGPAQKGDSHGDMVTGACEYLLNKFPKNFYANTGAFFYDVPVLCLGSNYCLMPSRFEPGGIVQHEFFVASTPAVVFATGGLKDSVTEYNYRTGKGNGFEFLCYERQDLISALDRAYNAFKNKEVYRRLRKNAFESVIDVADVSKEWCSEIYRIRGKVYVDKVKYDSDLEEVKKESETASKDSDEDSLAEVDFKYCGKSTDQVYVAGSFNNWNDKELRMGYNHQIREFNCNVKVKPGRHYFKIKVNGKWRLDHHRKVSTDENGDEVNVLEL